MVSKNKNFVDIDKVEFKKLNQPELKVLLKALDIDENKLVCIYCHEKVGLDKVSVLPSFDSNKIAIITCDSPLCIGEYIQECEDSKEKHIKLTKKNKIKKQIEKEILDKIEKIGLKYFLDKPTDKTTFFTILKKDWKKLKQEVK